MNGGDYSPYRSKCDIYGPCQTPAHAGSKKRIVPKFKNQTHNDTYPLDGSGNPTIPSPSTTGSILNTFVADGTVDLTLCNEVGRQMAIARRTFHGRYGFQYVAGLKWLDKEISYTATWNLYFKEYFTVPADSPALHLSEISLVIERTYKQKIAVDPYSGLRTQSGWVDTKVVTGSFHGCRLNTGGVITLDDTTYQITDYNNVLANLPANTTLGYGDYFTGLSEVFSASGQLDWFAENIDAKNGAFLIPSTGATGWVFEAVNSVPNSTIAELENALAQIPTYGGGGNLCNDNATTNDTDTNTVTLTPSTTNNIIDIESSWAGHTPGAFAADHDIFGQYSMGYGVTITLTEKNDSTPTNPNSPIYDADQNLLGPWNFNDHKLFPLSNGPWNGVCVYVTRNEAQGIITPDGYEPGGYVDTSLDDLKTKYIDQATGGYIPLGGIVGAPYPLSALPGAPTDAYIENFYDGEAPVWSGPGVIGYGNWREAASYDLPPQATQWTTNAQFIFPLCRFVFCCYNPSTKEVDISSPAVYVSKYAESAVRLPSPDHSRPYGTDRQLEKPGTLADNCSDGVWTSPGMRYPTCPPMAGRLSVQSIVDNGDGTLTVTTDAAPVALDAPLDFLLNDMTPLKTNVSPTASSTTVFKVTAALADVAGAKWICLYGALPTDPAQTGVAHWYWADTRGKGNFVLGNWTLDTTATYGYGACSFTDECKGYLACAPWMIVTSGNAGDTPPAGMGVRFDFGAIVPFDEINGSGQWLEIIQGMTDPLYVQTPSNAKIACTGEAQPTCMPLVEARSIMPYALSTTATPDNGAGWTQNEAAPSGGDFANYTWVSPQFTNVGNVIHPPSVSDTTIFNQCPNGYFPMCCNQGTNPRCP